MTRPNLTDNQLVEKYHEIFGNSAPVTRDSPRIRQAKWAADTGQMSRLREMQRQAVLTGIHPRPEDYLHFSGDYSIPTRAENGCL